MAGINTHQDPYSWNPYTSLLLYRQGCDNRLRMQISTKFDFPRFSNLVFLYNVPGNIGIAKTQEIYIQMTTSIFIQNPEELLLIDHTVRLGK